MAREPGRLSMQPQEEFRCRLAAGAAAYDFEHNFKLQLRHDSETANRCGTTEPVSSAFLHGDAAADLLSLTTFPA